MDTAAAAATRARVLDTAATDRTLVAGMHLGFPAFGRVILDAAGPSPSYRFVPLPWQTAF